MAESPLGLQDLPEHRREALLWRFALELDYEGVDALVQEEAPHPCRWQFGVRNDEIRAIVGDDGRYHLLIDGHLTCGRRPKRASAHEPYRHEVSYHWWSDGTHYRIQAAPDLPEHLRRKQFHHRTVRWRVTLVGESIDACLVPPRNRCPATWIQNWPTNLNTTSAMGRVRTALVEELGARCHACDHGIGEFVDHGHFTGLVRGLLCRHCNTWIDQCPHPSGCPWGDYLNNPPATHLRLKYPKLSESLRRHQRKIDLLGIDPFAELRDPRRSGRARS